MRSDSFTAQERNLLGHVAEAIRAIEPTARIILYGSRARGDAAPDSDWDLLVLVDGPADHQRAATLRDRLFDLGLEVDTVFSVAVEGKHDWNSPLFRAMPFHAGVVREGVELLQRSATPLSAIGLDARTRR